VDLVLWECRKTWPASTGSNVVLTLGTDIEDDTKSIQASHFRHVFNDEFISRLCRSFMASLDGERVWRDLNNRLDENARNDYFCFNVSVLAQKSRLDDVTQMKKLKKYVHLQFDDSENRINTVSALLTTSFFLSYTQSSKLNQANISVKDLFDVVTTSVRFSNPLRKFMIFIFILNLTAVFLTNWVLMSFAIIANDMRKMFLSSFDIWKTSSS
jgi:hypothetical protein